MIVDAEENVGTPALKVELVDNHYVEPKVTDLTVNPNDASIKVGEQISPIVTVTGEGRYDKGYTLFSSDSTIASVTPDGVITGVKAGVATVTYRSVGDTTKTAVCRVTVTND